MKYNILLFLLMITGAANAADGIVFMDNPEWKKVLAKAKEDKKIIFLDAYAVWCGPCKQMDADVYTDKGVGEFYNTTFVNVKYDMEKGEGLNIARDYGVRSYPSFLFIDGDGKVVHKGLGLLVPAEFIKLGKTAADPLANYGSLRARAADMSAADFIAFSRQAMEMGDSEYDNIARQFLSKQPDILSSKELVDIVMRGVTFIDSEKNLAYIIANKEKIKALSGFPDEAIYQRTVGLTLAFAIDQFTDKRSNTVDLITLDQFFRKHIPKDAFYMSNYFQIEYYLNRGDLGKSREAYLKVLEDKTQGIEFNKICNLIVSFAASFPEEKDLNRSFEILDNYPLKPNEESSAFLRNMVKSFVYLKLQNKPQFDIYSGKLLNDPNAPETIKSEMRSIIAQQGS